MSDPESATGKTVGLGGIVAGLVLGLSLLAFLGAGAVAIVAWLVAGDTRPSIDVLSGDTLHLVGARGEELNFKLTGTSVEGNWASSTGLAVEVGTQSLAVAAPRGKDWEDSILLSAVEGDEFAIDAALKVPDLPAPETQTLEGAITGAILMPQERPDGTFENRDRSLDVPVVVEVVTEARSAQARSSREGPFPTVAKISAIAAGAALLLTITAGLLSAKLGVTAAPGPTTTPAQESSADDSRGVAPGDAEHAAVTDPAANRKAAEDLRDEVRALAQARRWPRLALLGNPIRAGLLGALAGVWLMGLLFLIGNRFNTDALIETVTTTAGLAFVAIGSLVVAVVSARLAMRSVVEAGRTSWERWLTQASVDDLGRAKQRLSSS